MLILPLLTILLLLMTLPLLMILLRGTAGKADLRFSALSLRTRARRTT